MLNKNQFLIDRDFSRKYEEHFCNLLSRDEFGDINDKGEYIIYKNKCSLNDGLHDDHGCDIYQELTDNEGKVQGVRHIDVKCYRRPKFVKHFKGAFIETLLPKSGRPGWFCDDSKITTHFLFVIDCSEENVEYSEAWLIDKSVLMWLVEKAKNADDIIEKSIDSASGFILPYEYIRQEGEQIVE